MVSALFFGILQFLDFIKLIFSIKIPAFPKFLKLSIADRKKQAAVIWFPKLLDVTIGLN